ncbi:MAG TPA: COX15/CtaA family protein [Thiolinea sp.]|nr:COX15/CtaA family protein [Thiolinea sp.]
MEKLNFRLLGFTLLLALVVIVLGAFTRLSDAGLGCPDWPGCYGHLTVPAEQYIDTSRFERPLEPHKAWAEMVHRYMAGTLGLFILAIFVLALVWRRHLSGGVLLPTLLLGTVVFQALLGMWTVTRLLSPVIVTAHLLGGFSTLALVWLLWLRSRSALVRVDERGSGEGSPNPAFGAGVRLAAMLGLLLVIAQIVLGGWTSTNYAAVACGVSYPLCHGELWPAADFSEGFSLQPHLQEGVDYEYGILENPARTAIHMAHRTGALVVFSFVVLLVLGLMRRLGVTGLGCLLPAMLVLVCTQFLLGVLNVVLALPLGVATAHNLVAALLLLSLIALNDRVFRTR